MKIIFIRLARRMGVIPTEPAKTIQMRYGINAHEMRDVVRSLWHESGADETVADFMLGHTIDSLGYNKIMLFRLIMS